MRLYTLHGRDSTRCSVARKNGDSPHVNCGCSQRRDADCRIPCGETRLGRAGADYYSLNKDLSRQRRELNCCRAGQWNRWQDQDAWRFTLGLRIRFCPDVRSQVDEAVTRTCHGHTVAARLTAIATVSCCFTTVAGRRATRSRIPGAIRCTVSISVLRATSPIGRICNAAADLRSIATARSSGIEIYTPDHGSSKALAVGELLFQGNGLVVVVPYPLIIPCDDFHGRISQEPRSDAL